MCIPVYYKIKMSPQTLEYRLIDKKRMQTQEKPHAALNYQQYNCYYIAQGHMRSRKLNSSTVSDKM